MSQSPAPASGLEASHWDPLVIALVGIVCCIFLLFSYHKILQRHCGEFGTMAFSRNPTQIRRLNENNSDSPSLQFQSRGLDSFVLRSLPITQFKKKNEEFCQESRDCAVCLGEFEEGQWLKHLPNCSHVFHVSCIDTWFQTHSSCPLCRSFVYNLTMDQQSVCICALLEALRREETHQERAEQFQVLRAQILQSLETQVAVNVDHSTSTE